MADKFCSRSGCTKKLRSNNTTGMCATGCESSESGGGKKAKRSSDVMRRFKLVARALGKNPDEVLEEAAQGWLNAVLEAVK